MNKKGCLGAVIFHVSFLDNFGHFSAKTEGVLTLV